MIDWCRNPARLCALLVVVASLGCGLSPTNTLEQQPLQLVHADHAFSVPLQAFASPVPSSERFDASSCVPPASIPLQYAYVEVAPDAIHMGGERLAATVAGGLVAPDSKRGVLITSLYESLLNLAETMKDAGYQDCAPWALPGEPPGFQGRLLIAFDRRLPWQTVQEVMFTAAQAQFADVYLRVDDDTPDATSPPRADIRATNVQSVQPGPGAVAATVLQELDQIAGSSTPSPVVVVLPSQDPKPGPATASPSEGETSTLGSDATVAVLRTRYGPPPTPRAERRPGLPAPPGTTKIKSGGLGYQAEPTDSIEAVLKRHGNQIRYCYQRILAKNPSLEGSLVIAYTIEPDGSVSDQKTVETTLNSPAVEKCVEGRFRRMKFPNQDAATTKRFSVTFSPAD